jgi:hypothetical protein
MSKVIDLPGTPGGHAKHGQRCEATTSKGHRCKRRALPGERFCHAHAPDRKEALREAGRRGGSVPRRPQLPEAESLDAEGARRVLAAVVELLLSGETSEGIARTCAYCLSIDAKLRETGELADRIERLEGESDAATATA